jgi:hypothetical protein
MKTARQRHKREDNGRNGILRLLVRMLSSEVQMLLGMKLE